MSRQTNYRTASLGVVGAPLCRDGVPAPVLWPAPQGCSQCIQAKHHPLQVMTFCPATHLRPAHKTAATQRIRQPQNTAMHAFWKKRHAPRCAGHIGATLFYQPRAKAKNRIRLLQKQKPNCQTTVHRRAYRSITTSTPVKQAAAGWAMTTYSPTAAESVI